MAERADSVEILLAEEGPLMRALKRVDPADFEFTREAIALPMGHPDDPAVPAALRAANLGHPHQFEKKEQTWYRVYTSGDAMAYNPAVPDGITDDFRHLMLATASGLRVSSNTLGGEVRDMLVSLAREAGHPVYMPDNAASGYIQALHYVIEVGRISLTMSEHNYAKVLEMLDKIDALTDDSRPTEKDHAQIIRPTLRLIRKPCPGVFRSVPLWSFVSFVILKLVRPSRWAF